MAWYTTDHARRDAERQALRRQQAGLLDKAQTSKQVTRYECIHCRALYGRNDEQCPQCGAFESVRSKTPNVGGNRLAEGKSELTGLLGGPTRSEKE